MNCKSTEPSQAAASLWGVEPLLDALLRFGTRIRRPNAWATVAVAMALVASVDHATGTLMWFGPVYLLIICAATWSLGGWSGLVTGIACAALSQSLNGPGLYPLGSAFLIWDVAMRFLAVAIIVALIGSVRRSHDREWRRARCDSLTGLLNRQGFFETLAESPPHGVWNMLVYLDLDGFKQINDRYGHAAGDTMLYDFAQGLKGLIRSTDLFARIGGDEFVLLMPASSEAEARDMVGLLHARINDLQGRRVCAAFCSMGVLIRGPQAGAIGERDLHLADELMYQAKIDGSRIRVSVADGERAAQRPPLDPSDFAPPALAA